MSSKWKIRREGEHAFMDLVCADCGKVFTIPTDDPLQVALVIAVSPRYSCPQCAEKIIGPPVVAHE